MKKLVLAILMIIALVLSVSMVSAAVTVQSTFSENAPTFGSEDQMASNPNADDEDDENIYDTGDVTLNASAAVTITSITVSPESGFGTDDLNITLNDADLSLAAGTPEAVTLKARIPENLDAVNSALEPVARKVAVVTFNFNDASTASFDVYMQRKNMLEISKVYVTVEGDRDSYDDGDNVEEVKPGDDVEVEVKAENTYDDDDDDVEIEDVELTVEIDDSDLDVDEDAEFGDIAADESEEATVSFAVDSDADDSTYDMEIFVEGDDEHGAKHGEKYTLDFEVERKSHDVVIRTTTLQEDSMSCTRGSNSITVKLYNLGKRDEDEVALYVSNADLDLDYEQTDIELDESDDYTKTVSFTVPSDLVAGTYPIRVKAFYSGDEDDGVLADLKDVDLVVSACVEDSPVSGTTTPSNVDITDSGEVIVEVPEDVLAEFGITETEEKTFTESGWFMALLIVLVVAALGGLTALIVLLVKRP